MAMALMEDKMSLFDKRYQFPENKQYRLISAKTIPELNEEVSKLLNESMFWEVHGTPIVKGNPFDEGTVMYYQAMRRWGRYSGKES